MGTILNKQKNKHFQHIYSCKTVMQVPILSYGEERFEQEEGRGTRQR